MDSINEKETLEEQEKEIDTPKENRDEKVIQGNLEAKEELEVVAEEDADLNEEIKNEAEAPEELEALEEAIETTLAEEAQEYEGVEEIQNPVESIEDNNSVEDEVSAEDQTDSLSEEEERQKDLALSFLKNAKAEYHSQYDRYELWALRSRDLSKEISELIVSVKNTLTEFNKDYETVLSEENDEATNKFIKNRIKGIELIGKMLGKLQPSLEKLKEIPKLEILNFDYEVESLPLMELKELKQLENNCYNTLSDLRSSTERLIRDYFKFINNNILNIVDGVESGLSFMEKKKLDNKGIKALEHIYISLDLSFSTLFEKLQISKIEVKQGEEVDFKYHEVFDIEETEDKEKNEKICDVMRRGYVYYKPLFGMDYNYVLRPAQVIVFKWEK